jgi:hypothetical protein
VIRGGSKVNKDCSRGKMHDNKEKKKKGMEERIKRMW